MIQNIDRYNINNIENEYTAIVTRGYKNIDNDKKLLLDIDVFGDYDDINLKADEIWNKLNKIRELKNEIFFSCLSDDLIEKLA